MNEFKQPWKPDWSLELETVFIDAENEVYTVFEGVKVFEEQEGLFRLYETPFLSELRFGDLIHAERSGKTSFGL